MPKPLKSIPLLSGETFTGHADEFRNKRLALFERIARTEQDTTLLRFFNMPLVVLSGPDVIREVLVEKWKSFHKTVGIRMLLYPLAGDGLFSSDGEIWRRQRKLMAPLFQPSYLETYAEGMVRCIDRWLDRFHDGDVIDVSEEATRLTMNVVSRALFDADTDGDARELGEAIAAVVAYITDQAGTPGLLAKMTATGVLEDLKGRLPAALERARAGAIDVLRHPLPWPTASSRRIREALRTLNALVDRMIADRRNAGLQRPDFLTRLLAARDEDDGGSMSDQQVRDEVLTLFFAGHETTAVTVTWVFFLLSQHPAVQARVDEEVAALGGRTPTAADLAKLPYLLRVIKETLRLYPPAPMFDRVTKEDVEVAGYALPRGTNLFILPHSLHRRADLFPDPARFDPDRFLPEAEEHRSRFAYLPFGGGPRVCIGSYFSLMEVELALAMITQRATLTPLPGQIVRPGKLATLRPEAPFLVKVAHKSPARPS